MPAWHKWMVEGACDAYVVFAGMCPFCRRFIESGGVYKLEFGPKAFIVVSDPVVVRYLLKVRGQEHGHEGGMQSHLASTQNACWLAT